MAADPEHAAGDLPRDGKTVLELYRLAVEQADRISARRGSANSYFLTLHTGLATVTGILAAVGETARTGTVVVQDVALLATALVGLLLSATWWLLLRSYRDLNTAKFKVITEIEVAHLPIRIFEREWQYLRTADGLPWWKGRYAELGFIERVVPALFMAIYVTLIVLMFAL